MMRRKIKEWINWDNFCNLIMIIEVIIAIVVGGAYGYNRAHQESLNQEEIDEMYNIALTVKELEILEDDKYIITISNDEVNIETYDDRKGKLKMDLASMDNNYEIEYKYVAFITAYMIFAYVAIFWAVISFGGMLIAFIISLICYVIKRVIKK